MSSFEVFSIDLAALERAVGSRDANLVGSLSTPEDPPELREAMNEIVGRGTRPFRGDVYSLNRVVLRLCRVLGRRINGNTCDLLDQRALDRVFEITRPLALGVRLDELVAQDVVPIVGLPIDHEFRFGLIEAARIPPIYARWELAQPSDPADDDADGLLAELGDWLEVAALRRESLVGIFWP